MPYSHSHGFLMPNVAPSLLLPPLFRGKYDFSSLPTPALYISKQLSSHLVFLCIWAHNQVSLSSVQLMIRICITEPLSAMVFAPPAAAAAAEGISASPCWLHEAALAEFDSEFPSHSPALL